MSDATATQPTEEADLTSLLDENEASTEAEAAAVAERKARTTARAEAEREQFGREGRIKVIGNLTRDAEYVDDVEDGKWPYIWGGIAVGGRRATEDSPEYPASFYTFTIYGAPNQPGGDDSTKPTSEQLQILAGALKQGQRVMFRGDTEIRPLKADAVKLIQEALGVSDEQSRDKSSTDPKVLAFREVVFGGRGRISLFVRDEECSLSALEPPKEGQMPNSVTLLPRLSDGNWKSNPKDIA